MIFEYPHDFAWLAVPAAALIASLRERARRRRMALAFSGPLWRRWVPPELERRRLLKECLLIGALAGLVLAYAAPRFGRTLRQVTRRSADVAIAVDVSASMLAEDVAPSRIVKARRELGLLVERLKGERVGLVAFGGAAFLQCPLTTDTQAVTMYLHLLDPASFPVPGTDLGAALRRSLGALPKTRSGPPGAIVLLTDGEDFGRETRPAVEEAVRRGVRVFTIGFGTPRGELIRLRNESGKVTGFKKDEKGQTVVSRLDEGLLSGIAQETGGRYFSAAEGELELEEIIQELRNLEKRDAGRREATALEHRFQIPLLIALLCLLIELLLPEAGGLPRRNPPEATQANPEGGPTAPKSAGRFGGGGRPGVLGGFAILLLFTSPACAGFRGKIQEGNSRYGRGEWGRALSDYRSAQAERPESGIAPYNAAAALYRMQRHEEALSELSRSTGTLSTARLRGAAHYNRGNCLYRLGKREEAIQAYEQALLENPDDEDAKFNLEFSRKNPPPNSKLSGQKEKNEGGKSESDAKASPALSKEEAEHLMSLLQEQEKELFEKRPASESPRERAPQGKDW